MDSDESGGEDESSSPMDTNNVVSFVQYLHNTDNKAKERQELNNSNKSVKVNIENEKTSTDVT